jgi:predicted nucleic acid-binding protein
MMTYLMGAFSQVTITTESAPVPPSDPDDEVFLLCAIDGNADYLVSEDKALTDLKTSYPKPVIGKSEELAVIFGA